MKKYFIIAAAALATLASCSKIETETPQVQTPISFKAFNYKTQTTKAAGPIAGTVYKTTDPVFGIFGYYLTDGKTWSADKADAQEFMGTSSAALPVSYKDSKWQTANTYYWPFTGSLTFVGYSPYYADAASSGETGTGNISASFSKTANTLTFTDFTPSTSADKQVDLMYSNLVEDQKNNTTDYVSENASATTYKGVPVVFSHALSQVVFKVKQTTKEAESGLNIDINSISLDLVSKGTFTANYSTPAYSWALGTTPTTATFSPIVSGGSYMTAANTEGNVNTAEHIDLTDSFKELTPMLIIPQTVPSTTSGEPEVTVYNKIVVNYSLTQNGVTVTDNISIPLTSVENKFDMGKKYVLELVFGPEAIYFSPSIAADWEENTGDDVSNTVGVVTITYNKK